MKLGVRKAVRDDKMRNFLVGVVLGWIVALVLLVAWDLSLFATIAVSALTAVIATTLLAVLSKGAMFKNEARQQAKPQDKIRTEMSPE